ncbi:uncharacterized protein LOC133779387 [Humulus lupulus]|uniref:uncharacterized protein LOC133779387 n=1 Tax=Humulus lupulus TaxID=3486 RepID=UPI002B4045AE|nr:uncharacterized protein LOC133779387 [Humulus lupulus]
MEIPDNPPRSFQFINEHGQVVEQSVEYEWLPTKCKSCSGFGHSMAECRKDLKAVWVEKVPPPPPAPPTEENQLERTDKPDGTKGGPLNTQEEGSQATEEAKSDEGVTSTTERSTSGQAIERSKEGQWLTPRRVSTQKTGPFTGVHKQAGSAQNKGNQFGILQDQERGGGLLETKLRGKKIEEFMEHRFPNWDYFTSPRTEGRLLILWRKGGVFGMIYLGYFFLSKLGWFLVILMHHFSVGDRTGGSSLASSELVDSVGWKNVAKVEAIKSMGSYFTWTNNQDGLARIYSKIDHALIDEDWLDLFPQSVAVFQWEAVSDHCSCIVSNISLNSMGTKLFRYYNFWSNHPDFKQIVLKSWEAPVKSSGLKAIFTRLIRLKHQLKKINRDWFGDVGLGYHLALEELQTARFQAQEKPIDFQLQEVVKVKATEFNYHEKIYHSFLVQRSKINWLRHGDMNSSFFHAFLKRRKTKNSIVSYTNDNGVLVDDFKEVVSHFSEHFKSHLGTPSSASGMVDQNYMDLGSKLSVEQQLYLLKPFSPKEIKAALFSIPNTKSPGPGGYGSGFFKSMWKDIGQDICSAISHGFSMGQFPKELHETTLSLIPKVVNPARASDYRPIACCSTLYKVMAKLLCSRLVVVLHYLVQSNQRAFVRGRSIAHNIMILQDLIKNYGRAITSPRCAIKIDISKAYDTVDWLFLVNLLKAFCFPSKFINWVMICIRSTTYSLLINGRVQCTFKGGKGLRQGDPMSPLLFILIMEYLTRGLQSDAKSSSFRYHPMCKDLKLINLCFADDVILFCKGTVAAVSVLKDSLQKFSEATGLSINSKKSQVYFGGVAAGIRIEILHGLNLSAGSFPMHYLGVPLRPTKWKHTDCELIIQKMRVKLFSKHLSYAGRLLLIQTVLSGLRNYWMSIFTLPQSIIKEVEKLCRQFLWGASGTRCKFHLASWNQVCLPKAYGGLGLRDGTSWNRALLARYIWAVSTKQDSLWVKWIQHVYLKGVNFLDYDLKHDSSWYWRKLCLLRTRFNEKEILAAGVSGAFRPSKLYFSSINQHIVAYKEGIWCRTILPKHRFLLWMVINSFLLTRDNLAKCTIPIDSHLCPVCEDQVESHIHLFFDCYLSQKILHCIISWLGFHAWASSFSAWTVGLNLSQHNRMSMTINMILATAVYQIWRNRNRCIYDGFSLSANCIAKEIVTLVQYRIYSVHSRKSLPNFNIFLRKLASM